MRAVASVANVLRNDSLVQGQGIAHSVADHALLKADVVGVWQRGQGREKAMGNEKNARAARQPGVAFGDGLHTASAHERRPCWRANWIDLGEGKRATDKRLRGTAA